jgi:hypothetical protein
MAKYIGSLTTDARGKHGGIVFGRGRSGTIFKAKAVPVQTRSPYQLAQRSMFGGARAAWLNPALCNQVTYNLLANLYTYTNTLGQTYQPTGLQLWTQAWVNAAICGSLPLFNAPLTPPSISNFTGMRVTRAGSSLTWTADVAGSPWFGSATLSVSAAVSQAITFVTNTRRRPMGFILNGDAIEFSSAWLRAYGARPLADTPLSVRAVPIDPTSFLTGTPVTNLTFVT